MLLRGQTFGLGYCIQKYIFCSVQNTFTALNDTRIQRPHLQAVQEDDFGTGCCAPMQRHLWNLFENPDHSKAAKVKNAICQFHLSQYPHPKSFLRRHSWAIALKEGTFVGFSMFHFTSPALMAPQLT